ncbi:cation-efflux pump [Tissierella sp. P1]|nr:cation-efflux pump [Tissierella sp. P1]
MLTEYFLNLATKGNHNYLDKSVRERIGYIAGFVGLFVNLLLSILKLITGLIMSSIAVTADAFNNLSDTASSIMTVIGFKLSNAPPDKEHPYGHGRIEYLTALIIAFMVMVVGFQFVKSSVDRIISPKAIEFQIIPFILLVISISLKIWLSFFNRKLGNKISSAALRATATDALGDVIITSVVAFSLLLSLITEYPIDGYVGILVSIFILYSGFSLVKETLSQLIGEAPHEDLIRELTEGVLSYDYILGVHDLIVHNYGPGKVMATIDAEIPSDIDVVTIHNIIDQAERELSEKFNLHLVIHMDPIGFQSKESVDIMNKIKNRIKKDSFIKSMHDFNIIEDNGSKIVVFHVVVDGNKSDKQFSEEEFKIELAELIKEINPNLDSDIIIDMEY